MSLNARDRQALSLIEEELASSDPRFASRLSAFARLADGEGMPARERIRPDKRIGAFFRSRRCLCWTAGAVWLAVSLALIVVALVLSHISTPSACAQWQGLVCAQRSAPSAPRAPGGHGGTGHGAGTTHGTGTTHGGGGVPPGPGGTRVIIGG